jgi:AAA+ ATPase superfamily predicted ATPase
VFRTSSPATGPLFRNRTAELGRLEKVVDSLVRGSPRWLAVVGSRKIGKTSLVLEAARRVEDGRVRFVIIDVFESLPVSMDFFRTYSLRVCDRLLANQMGASIESLAADPAVYRQVLASSEAFAKLPGALRGDVLSLADRQVDEALVKLALDLPERLAEAVGLSVVVAIDEFQELAGLGTKRDGIDSLPLMRSLWQRHKSVTYVVSGSARSMLTEMVTSRRSPFFQHFDLMELGPFTTRDAVALLVEQSKGKAPIGLPLAERAAAILGGHPFYLQVLGEALSEREPPHAEEDLKEVLQQVLFARTGRLALYFQNEFERLVGRSSQLAAALTAMAEGPMRLTDIAARTRTASGATVRLLERLGDAVTKGKDGRYALFDPTFALWLEWRAPGGTVVPMKVVGDEAERAVAEALMMLGFDLVYQSRASRGAFDLLATRGARQLGVQVKRVDLPLRFPKLVWKRMEAEANRFGWRWIVAAVDKQGEVIPLDPARHRAGKQITLERSARIENLLSWLDRSTRGK